MDTTKLTVRLPADDLEYANQNAREHGIALTALIDRYLARLRSTSPREIHPDVERLSGLVPADVGARAALRTGEGKASMKVAIDLNVVLDVVQRREPHYAASAAVRNRVAAGTVVGFLPAHALPTLLAREADAGG